MHYGVPIMGSKNMIAKWVIDKLPAGDTLVEPFAGGCSITHCAANIGKYRHYIVNDISDAPKLFADAIQGKYKNERRWITREEFYDKWRTDPYIAYCWSFGNNPLRHYCYSYDNEEVKHTMWDACCLPTVQERYYALRKFIRTMKDYDENLQSLQNKSNLNRCQTLSRLIRIQNIENANLSCKGDDKNGDGEKATLRVVKGSYLDLKIPDGSIIYCDPPYKETTIYNKERFDYDVFYDWLLKQKCLVIISEYNMPSEFCCIDSISKRITLASQNNTQIKTERLFVPCQQMEQYREAMNKSGNGGLLF